MGIPDSKADSVSNAGNRPIDHAALVDRMASVLLYGYGLFTSTETEVDPWLPAASDATTES